MKHKSTKTAVLALHELLTKIFTPEIQEEFKTIDNELKNEHPLKGYGSAYDRSGLCSTCLAFDSLSRAKTANDKALRKLNKSK